MSKKDKRRDDVRRQERQRARFAELERRAAAAAATAPARERIKPVGIEGQEEKYEPLLYAIESAFASVYRQYEGLIVDTDAERALRLLIARYAGAPARRSGSTAIDTMADMVAHRINLFLQRNALVTPAEIIGCLRRVIRSINLHHAATDPRAYFTFIQRFVPDVADEDMEAISEPGAWQQAKDDGTSAAKTARPGGLWLPGDPL